MVEQLVYDLETDILIKIAKHLSTGAIESAEWQARKLGELGLLNYEVRKLISKYRGRIMLQTSREVRESADDILALIRKHSPKGKKAVDAKSKQVLDIIDTWVSSATMKTNLAMASLAESAGRKYVASVSKASLSVISGADTLQRSMMQSISEMDSLDAFVDKAGRHWTPEGYTKMVIRDNQRRVSTEVMFQAAKDGETDLIEISSHIGARPKCAPYQGKIYSISGTHPKYPALSSTSYGEIDGLNGINCGHIFYPFWEGVSEKTYDPYPAKQNEKVYEQSQEQRAAERKIRYYKRKEAIAKATKGGEAQAKKWRGRVRDSQAEMRALLEKTGRTRQRDREAIYT